jgi:hypothetical protein
MKIIGRGAISKKVPFQPTLLDMFSYLVPRRCLSLVASGIDIHIFKIPNIIDFIINFNMSKSTPWIFQRSSFVQNF